MYIVIKYTHSHSFLVHVSVLSSYLKTKMGFANTLSFSLLCFCVKHTCNDLTTFQVSLLVLLIQQISEKSFVINYLPHKSIGFNDLFFQYQGFSFKLDQVFPASKQEKRNKNLVKQITAVSQTAMYSNIKKIPPDCDTLQLYHLA